MKRIKWDAVIDLIMLVIFSLLTIYMLGVMVFRGLDILELFMLFVCPAIASGCLDNIVEE